MGLWDVAGSISRPSQIFAMSTRGKVGRVTMVIIVWTHFLHQFVVGAVEGDEDADDLEGFGAEPGHMALGLLLVAGLRRIKVAECVLGPFLHLFILDATVEGLGVLHVNDGLLSRNIKLHYLGRRHQADRHIALTR